LHVTAPGTGVPASKTCRLESVTRVQSIGRDSVAETIVVLACLLVDPFAGVTLAIASGWDASAVFASVVEDGRLWHAAAMTAVTAPTIGDRATRLSDVEQPW
jgi:hypothetical protein